MKLPTPKQVKDTLAKVDERRKTLEQGVNACCMGYSPAMFVYGPAGMGKSHTIRTLLDAVAGGNWVLHTAHATPKALVLALAENPHAIQVFEDCESMLKGDLNASILRAACGAPDNRDRWVTWESANEKLRFKIDGAIIIQTNENLSRKNGPMQGVASRFRPIFWGLSYDEVIAVIMDIAERGRQVGKTLLSAAECKKVVTELLELLEQHDMAVALDIRLYTEHALPAYAFSKATGNKDWHGLLAAKLTGLVKGDGERQAERTDRLVRIAQQIAASPVNGQAKLARWKELTGLEKSIYYRYAKPNGSKGGGSAEK